MIFMIFRKANDKKEDKLWTQNADSSDFSTRHCLSHLHHPRLVVKTALKTVRGRKCHFGIRNKQPDDEVNIWEVQTLELVHRKLQTSMPAKKHSSAAVIWLYQNKISIIGIRRRKGQEGNYISESKRVSSKESSFL